VEKEVRITKPEMGIEPLVAKQVETIETVVEGENA